MRLEFVRIQEANDLVNQLIEHHPQAIFLVDHDFKIKFFNKAFQELSKSDKADILEHEFCEILGCTRRGKLVYKDERFCKFCQIRDLLSGSNLSEMSMIQDFEIHNALVTKHFHITTHRLVMNGIKYRLVVIDDRSQKH